MIWGTKPAPSSPQSTAATPFPRRKAILLRALAALAGVAVTAIIPFYAEEDWRGKKDWQNYKRDVEARGGSLDWADYIPPSVPDDQNFFKAPHMNEWFVQKTGNELTSRLNPYGFLDFLQRSNINTVAELTVVSSDARVSSDDADIVLQYNPPFLNIAETSAAPAKSSGSRNGVIPLIVMDQVPLLESIKALARQQGLNYSLDPGIPWTQTGPDGKPVPQPCVSFRWTNITARQALTALLRNYNLHLIKNAGLIARIASDASAGAKVAVNAAVSEQMTQLIQAAFASGTNGPLEPAAVGSLYLALFDRPMAKIKPLRILVRSEKVLSSDEVSQFFPASAFASVTAIARPVRVSQIAPNSFRLTLNPESYTDAADYLAWSDQFQPDFDAMREALKRPCAVLTGDYRDPAKVPHPNYMTVRVVAQALTQRAQCQLLLGRPDPALRELTLLHDLCRLLGAQPGSRSTTLVSAMIKVAVTGIYTSVIADGTRLHAWTAPQLLKLEDQLREIDLLPSFVNALGFERAAWCRVFETANPVQCEELFAQSIYPPTPASTNLWQQLHDPVYLLMNFAPRGWVYQNMLKLAVAKQKTLDCFDPGNRPISPSKIIAAGAEIQSAFHNPSPQTLLASRAVTDTTMASMSLAFNQTRVREALIACAIERYWLQRGYHPDSLNALVPQFIKKIPSDVIDGGTFKYCGTWAQFTLYSFGWKQKDNGAAARFKNDGSLDIAASDWVWPNQLSIPR